jgi:hypothetical protein
MIKIFKKSGIEEGKKIEYMSILFRPIETKEIWENCAKIIVSQSKEKTSRYHYELLHWLENKQWPGYDIIFEYIKKIPETDLYKTYGFCIKEADKEQKNEWLNNLISLLKEKNLYNYLTEDEKRIINKMRKK